MQEVSLASLPNLPRSGLMRRGTCFQQPEQERRTGAVGCSWSRGQYPTPSAQEYGTSQNEGKVPHKRPSRGTQSLGTWARNSTCRSGRQHPTICSHGGECLWSLNPLFVAWLMGLPPIGVNGSTQSATLLSRWLRRMRTELYRRG